MSAQHLNPEQARLHLALLDAEARGTRREDLYAWLTNAGLPPDMVDALATLIDRTQYYAGKVIHVGRIILIKIVEFAKAHPNLAIGAAIGAAVACLVKWIPILGPILGMAAIAVGAVCGHQIDKGQNCRDLNFFSVTENLIEIAREFLALFIEIWKGAAAEWGQNR
ncbi:MAG: DUF2273 domain-containing protein [Verrucomicrobia bacterium]|nr:DUF2273 domain-containing protein [Verrucomicrobiota bacterium]